MKQITLLVITDGRRDCLRRTLDAFSLSVDTRTVARRVAVNDCVEDDEFVDWVDTLGFDDHLRPAAGRRGFAGAIAAGWETVAGADFVFHLEDDFVLQRHVDLTRMMAVLADHPEVAQMALRRQAWNEDELAAGGVIESHPTDFSDRCDRGQHWLAHRRFFTTNPSLYPGWILDRGWPVVPQSEGVFGCSLFADPGIVCGYWGKRADPPWVHHIGTRNGVGY